MSALSNVTIRMLCTTRDLIEPYNPNQVQPCSYDLALDSDVVVAPHQFILLSTIERVHIPGNLQGQIYGRSSLGRKGIFIHISAGFIDAGFRGNITLECYNVSDKWEAKRGDLIAQISFYTLDHWADPPYGGRYQNQEGVTASRL